MDVHPMKITDLPFVKHVGVTTNKNGLCLELSNPVSNHVGSLHAGALYTLAEAASGQLVIETFMYKFPNAQAVVRNGEIKYRRPAMQKCSAKANVEQRSVEHAIDALEQRGRTLLEIHVKLTTETDVVADAEFTWWLSR